MPSKYIDTVSSYNKETPIINLFAYILLSSYLSNITVTNTVHGKILEVEIIITDEAIGEENFGESAGCLSVIPVYLYWQGKFGELYTYKNFPMYCSW